MIRKGVRKCPHSDPMRPHYFKPLFRGQVACCVEDPMRPKTFWQAWQQERFSAQDENSKEMVK